MATALLVMADNAVFAQGQGPHKVPPGHAKKYKAPKKVKHPPHTVHVIHHPPVPVVHRPPLPVVNHPPLVIMDTRHLPIRRYSDNRYYYRTSAGLHYWLGRDGHLYLDVKFVQAEARYLHDYAIWQRGRV